MFKSIKIKAAALAAGFSCLLVAYALAQPGQTGQPDRPPSPPQTGVGLVGQPNQPLARGESREVDQYFAACLLARNQAEVEISKLALERAQNPQVKQFAQQMIADHQALIPKLQQIAGTQFNSTRTTTNNQPSGIQQANYDTPANTSGQVNQLGQPGQGATPGQPGQMSATGGRTIAQTGDSLTQVAAIQQQIGERMLESMKEKLQQKQGAEFDHCYLGGQIACHMEVAAELEVLKDHTAGPLRQIVQEAEPKVKQHLASAEQIGEQLMNASTRQAGLDRPATETVPRVPR